MNSPVKKLLFLTLALCLLAPLTIPAQDVVTLENKDVIAMVEAGLKSELIVAKIKSTRRRFDTDPSVLAELRQKGVPDEVLTAMAEYPDGHRADDDELARQPHDEAPTRIVELIVPDGTPVEIEVAETVDPGMAEEGSLIRFRVSRAVKVDGTTVIARGASATARVVKAKESGNRDQAGTPAWEMRDVVSVDGSRIPLQFSKRAEGDSEGSAVATGMAMDGLLFWPAAPPSDSKKGKDAVIPAGERFEASARGDSTVKAKIPVSDLETETAAAEASLSSEASPDTRVETSADGDAVPARPPVVNPYPHAVRRPEDGSPSKSPVITDIRNRKRIEGFRRRAPRQSP
jgi:hypothetical protein